MQKRGSDYPDSEEGRDIRQKLLSMAASTTYNTTSTYSANNQVYPDNLIPFVDKHMNYIMNHPNIEASKYLANIKLISRVR